MLFRQDRLNLEQHELESGESHRRVDPYLSLAWPPPSRSRLHCPDDCDLENSIETYSVVFKRSHRWKRDTKRFYEMTIFTFRLNSPVNSRWHNLETFMPKSLPWIRLLRSTGIFELPFGINSFALCWIQCFKFLCTSGDRYDGIFCVNPASCSFCQE